MSLVWEGLELQPSHRRWRFWIAQGRDDLPETRGGDDLLPFRRGRLPRQAIGDRRRLEVKGYIQEASLAAFRAQADTLKGLLDPEAASPGILVDTMEDGTLRWIRALPRNIIPVYAGDSTRMMSIELDALDPYWYGSWGTLALDGGYLLNDDETLDSSAEVIVSPTSTSHELSLDTLGTAAVERVRIRISGPSLTAPSIEVVTPDGPVGFAYGAALTATQELEIDNDGRTVLLDGVGARASVTLRAANRNGEYVRLLAGSNTVRIFGQPTTVRILFTPTYQ